MTKTQHVLEHLQSQGSITSLEAIYKYKATRLSAIIFNLRKKGLIISTNEGLSKDEDGRTIKYAVYKLES